MLISVGRLQTLIMYMPYTMGRQEFIWGEDAKQWRPQRWIEFAKRGYKPSAYEYPVFNVRSRLLCICTFRHGSGAVLLFGRVLLGPQAGPRTCLGQNMALLEGTICLATMFSVRAVCKRYGKSNNTEQTSCGAPQALEFQLLSKDVTYNPSVTLPIKDGLWVAAKRRSRH